MKIAGVVVLYNTDIGIIDKIMSYVSEVDILFVIDNSDIKDEALLSHIRKIDKCFCIDNNGNQGIANALNAGARLAIENNCEYLLTMDQDSKFISKDPIREMVQVSLEYPHTAIISPIHKSIFTHIPNYKNNVSVIFSAMTSGNLLSLRAFQKIGNFREDYFIDYVDAEFCLRARMNGFAILQCNTAILEHNLGNITKHKYWHATNHSCLRRYYITRNRLVTMLLYKEFDGDFFQNQIFGIFMDTLKIVFSEKQKIKKLKMVYKGYKDFKKGIMGKYRQIN
jgi:rhamnosyltransferase